MVAPAERAGLGYLEAHLGGEVPEAGVVVAALAAGVLHLAGAGEPVRGLVQQGAQDVAGAAGEAFAGDEHLGQLLGLAALPAGGGEVPEGEGPGPAPAEPYRG